MRSLADILLAAHQRDDLIRDCAKLVEEHISKRSGLKGMGLKAGLLALKSIKPDALLWAASRLLPDFVTALEPLYREFRASSDGDFSVFLQKQSAHTVEALLAVTDARAARSGHAAAKSLYARFRGMAEHELAAVLPAFSRLLTRYLD